MVVKPFERVIKWTFQNVMYMLSSYSSKDVVSICVFNFFFFFTNFSVLEEVLAYIYTIDLSTKFQITINDIWIYLTL